jgi:protoheme IX farnesyltransferase
MRRTFPRPSKDRPLLLDLWDLTKPEISFLVTISALAGFLLGSPTDIDGAVLCMTLLGTALTAGGVGVLNHYLERHLDAQMRRTADRPLPAGRIRPAAALAFGVALTAGGVTLLYAQTNLLTTALAALTVALYLFVYTPLKQRTPWNTIVGTIPGALPALGGWTAASGTLGWGGAVIFAILAFWQMPHFLSLAWMYRKDYERAGYAMLPVVEPDGHSTAWQTLAFTALLSLAAITLGLMDVTGWTYLPGALVLNVWFFVPVYAFFRSRTARDARRVLMASILYIPLLLVLIFVDRLVQ